MRRGLPWVLVLLACGRSDLERGVEGGALSQPQPMTMDAGADRGTPDAGARPARCFPGDPSFTLACPLDQFCNYAWGSGPTELSCAPFAAECAAHDCDCVLHHPPPVMQFCAARHCEVRDSGLLVLTCAPD